MSHCSCRPIWCVATSSPLVIAGVPACADWLKPSVASLGNSSHDNCQKHLLAHVILSPGAEHPTFKVLFYLFPGCTFPLLSSIYHMPLRSFCVSHMAACPPCPNLRSLNLMYPFLKQSCLFIWTLHCFIYLCVCVCVIMRISFP